MHVKFKITFDDNTTLESHDRMYNQVKDHCNALPPEMNKKWTKYELITDEGQFISTSFKTGLFNINGQLIHPADENGYPLTHKEEPQDFNEVEVNRRILNGLPYYPIFGRRYVKGDWGDAVIYFCGWKRKMTDRQTIQKIAYLYPNGEVILT